MCFLPKIIDIDISQTYIKAIQKNKRKRNTPEGIDNIFPIFRLVLLKLRSGFLLGKPVLKQSMDRKDGSAVKRVYCSCRGPKFDSGGPVDSGLQGHLHSHAHPATKLHTEMHTKIKK